MASLEQVRRGSRLSLVLGMVVAAVLFAAVAYADDNPAATCPTTGSETVATDQGDYAPGSVVHITGDGYTASCDVVVKVTRPDGSVVHGDGSSTPGSDSVTTGDAGDLAYDYQLNAIEGEYSVEVLGADAVLATTTFTDALTFDQNNVDLSPVWVQKPTSTTSTTRTFSLLVEQDSPDTAIKCIQMIAPNAQWHINSVTMTSKSAGTWNSGTILNNNAKFVDASGTGLPGGTPGFARIEINATTPTTDGSGQWSIRVGTSGANAVADQGCAVTASNQAIATYWDDAWPNGTNRIYTTDFRDAGGAVIPTPQVLIGGTATYRVRVTLTGTTTAPNGDDKMSYATIALPPCFSAISVTNPPTVFSPTTTRNWTASSLDNVIRLRANTAATDPLVDESPDDYVQVTFTATATNACSAGSSTWSTAAWGGTALTPPGSSRSSSINVARVFANTGSDPTVTFVTKLTPTTSSAIHNAAHAAVTAVPVGATVHDFVTVSGGSGNPTPTGNVNVDWFTNNTCATPASANSGSIGPLASGQFDATGFPQGPLSAGLYGFKAHYEGNATYFASDGPCEPLRVVDANIQISGNGVNRVGQNHTFTGHVNVNDGTGFTNAPPGTTINFSFNGNPPSASCTTVGTTGSCTTTYSSAVTGVDTVNASTTVSVSGVPLTRTTDGTGANSGPATKRWVNARISIAASATNEVNHSHTFTVTLEQDTGDGNGFVAASGQHVDFTLTNANGANAVLDAGASSCDDAGPNTNAAGQCTIVFTSASAGKVTGTATSTLSVAGSAAFTVTTDGVAPNSGAAVKTFVDANIQITPATDVNPVGANHVLTITVNAVNGTIDAGSHTATATIASGPGSFVPAVGGDTCTYTGGAATASCTVTITSSTAGTTKVSASASIPVSGVSVSRSTDGTGTNSGPATKYWADDSVTTVVRDAANNDITNTTVGAGTVVHDEATVAKTSGTPAAVPSPTGTVAFTLYNNGTCDGLVLATDPAQPLNSSGTASSSTFVIPAVLGPYSYRAHYNGDTNYPAHDGPCEPFNFDGVPPVTTITFDPATPDSCCWYVFTVKVTVSATDVGTGVAETRCVIDPVVPPATFDDLPAGPCPYLGAGAYVFNEGIHTIYAASRDMAGNKETPVSRVLKLDKSPPTSTMGPQPTFQPNPGPFTVSWSATDTVSGVKDYDVRYRVAPAGGSFGAYTQWFTDTTQTSASFTPTPGSTVCFSVKARDNACWEEPHYGPEVCTTAPYDDPSLARTGMWSTVSGSGYFGPGVSRSTSPGNKLTLANLRGSVIGVLATKQPGGGTIELRWNGLVKATISLNAASVLKKQLITFTLPSVQTGTLDIVQTGYGTVDIDAAGAYKDS